MAPETRAQSAQTQASWGLIWWLIVCLSGFAALTLTLTGPQVLGIKIKPGTTLDTDIVAKRSASVIDETATGQAREAARQSVLPVFKREPGIDQKIRERLHARLETVGQLQKSTCLLDSLALAPEEEVYLLEASPVLWNRIQAGVQAGHLEPAAVLAPEVETSVISKLKAASSAKMTAKALSSQANLLGRIEEARAGCRIQSKDPDPDLLFLAASSRPESWTGMHAAIDRAAGKILKLGPIIPDMPSADWERTALEFLPEKWPDKIRWTSSKLIASALEPNVVVDRQATILKMDHAAQLVPPVTKNIRIGEIVAPKGQIVSAEMSSMLKKLGVTRTTNWPMVLSLVFSLVAACTFFGFFLHTYAPKHLFSPSSIGLIFTISIACCAIAAFIGQDFPQFVPLPAAALITTIFFGPKVSAGLVMMLIIFLKVDNLIETNNLLALSAASALAIGTNIRQRAELMFRGLLIGLTQAAGFFAASALSHSFSSVASLAGGLFLQMLGGLSSLIVAIGSLPLLENIFGMVTPFRVIELAGSDQPLLRQLEENAPGTYQHSLAVANLAEAGARAIGADVALVRAGSLYHDIGKMVRPRYFIENQLGDANPHDSIEPEESRDRVLAHVTDGLKLAQKYALPKAVQDFIPQHQGTTLMAYFFHKACLRDGTENVDPGFYRYPGPKPQSKECAIVMLADVSEAVTHSLNDPSQEEVEAQMSVVFKARWDDGQFTESGLAASELERVKKAFARVWRTLHHERLKYPSTTTGRMPIPPGDVK